MFLERLSVERSLSSSSDFIPFSIHDLDMVMGYGVSPLHLLTSVLTVRAAAVRKYPFAMTFDQSNANIDIVIP